jgi:glyoxylase-like metal-dependent hydrolase (beta-lactamase superfamily II)
LKVGSFLVKNQDAFLLIDTGDPSDRSKLEQELERAGVKAGNLRLVLLTHGDFDHAGNAAFLRDKYAAKIAIHAGDAEMVRRGDQLWNRKANPDRLTLFGKFIIFLSTHMPNTSQFDAFSPDLTLEDGADLAQYGFDARVIHLPGHSKGSIGILTSRGDLFCGDLLMNVMRPELHFLIDDLAECDHSIRKLSGLNIQTVYPGHGRPFRMAQFYKIYQPKS